MQRYDIILILKFFRDTFKVFKQKKKKRKKICDGGWREGHTSTHTRRIRKNFTREKREERRGLNTEYWFFFQIFYTFLSRTKAEHIRHNQVIRN